MGSKMVKLGSDLDNKVQGKYDIQISFELLLEE